MQKPKPDQSQTPDTILDQKQNPDKISVLLVGFGQMGRAILQAWHHNKSFEVTGIVIDPAPVNPMPSHWRFTYLDDFRAIPTDFSPQIVLFAVKPQIMEAQLGRYKKFVTPDCLFISVVAGKTLAFLAEKLGPEAHLIRAMPNTPVAIGAGMTVMCPSAHCKAVQVALANRLLSPLGDVAIITEEKLMDAVTALSGSGPAYIFLMIEAMRDAGIALGLPPKLSSQLALQTVAGAGMLARNLDVAPETLRQNVTSKGGTTEAALSVLRGKSPNLSDLVKVAMRAAAERSKELS